MINSTYISLTAGAAQTGENVIYALTLTAGADAATLTIYDNTVLGSVARWKLAAVANTSASISFPNGLHMRKGIYVVLTGTSPVASAAVENKSQTTVEDSSSPSASLSPSSSISPSNSPSISPSSSRSPSNSPSISPSSSKSPSSSISPSSSESPSYSPSPSISPSGTASPSASVSPSYP